MKYLIAARDWVWNTLFLDFYLDPHWTLKFKIINLVSGDDFRSLLTCARMSANKAEKNYQESPDGKHTARRMHLDIKHMRIYTEELWDYYRK